MFDFNNNQFLNRSVDLGGAFASIGIRQNGEFAVRVQEQAAQMTRILSALRNNHSMTPQDQEAGLNPQMTFPLIIDAVLVTRASLDELYRIRDQYLNELHELHQDTCSGSACCLIACLIGVIGVTILLAAGLDNGGFSNGGDLQVLILPIIILSMAAFCCLLSTCLEGGSRLAERNEKAKFTRSIEAGNQQVMAALLEVITQLGESNQTLSPDDLQRINDDARFPSDIKAAIFRAAGIEIAIQEGTCTFLSSCCARIFGARNDVAGTEMVVFSPVNT